MAHNLDYDIIVLIEGIGALVLVLLVVLSFARFSQLFGSLTPARAPQSLPPRDFDYRSKGSEEKALSGSPPNRAAGTVSN